MSSEVQLVNHNPIRRETTKGSWSIQETYSVKSGDTLSEIVREHLVSTGREVTREAIYQGVRDVARANGISDPDRIFIGQRIRLDIEQRRSTDSFPEVLASAKPSPPTEAPGAYANVLQGPATLSSAFGLRTHPVHQHVHHHAGVDLAADANTPITAMRAGTVSYSGWKPGYGHTVIIDHADGMETQYSHASKRMVEAGDRVSAETVVGLVGESGIATGPHLHFEVKRYGQAMDPLPYLFNEAQ